MVHSQRVEFAGGGGDQLAALIDLPTMPVVACAIFAHCFTCSKDLFATQRIATELARRGIAVLRFDFTGLGASGGEFANSNFSSNVGDLIAAAAFVKERFAPAAILIGHSLGGAAVLSAAGDLPEVCAVVTIGAPADTEHVIANFNAHVDEIERAGKAEVELGGRRFTIERQFLDDVRSQMLEERIARLRKPLLVLHSPTDDIVGIDNARRIFDAARHPKSFVALDGADHLLTRRADAEFVAEIVSVWAGRYIARPARAASNEPGLSELEGVRARATGKGRFQSLIETAKHRFLADEPESYGGMESGPSPYDFLSAALGACTSMTLRLYAERKGWDLPPFTVDVSHAKIHTVDCMDCTEGSGAKIDRFERRISFSADLDAEAVAKVLEIADKCPVHRTLEARSLIETDVETAG